MASYTVLQKLVVLSQLLAIAPTQVRAQSQGGPIGNLCPSNFTQVWGMAAATLASVGLNNTELCTINGTLWNAVSSAQACLETPTTSIPARVGGFDSLNSALSQCNSALTSSISASCGSVVTKSENCTVSISVFGQPTPIVGFWDPAKATVSTSTVPTNTAQTGAQSSTQQPTSTGNPSSAEGSNQSNIGTVAGVAVGAALGAIAIAATVAFLIWRCRRKAKAQKNNRNSSSVDDDDAEKAQLPGDEAGFSKVGTNELGNDLSSDRKELAGPPVYARTIASLQELDGSSKHDKRISMKELASNEEVASEMATTEHSGSHTGKSSAS